VCWSVPTSTRSACDISEPIESLGAVTMRKALVVGINHYDQLGSLYGCVNDASTVRKVLAKHGNKSGDTNFTTPRLLTASNSDEPVTRQVLRDAVEELFATDDLEIGLFYFAGHGYVDSTGGFLCSSECVRGDDGLSLAEVMAFVNSSTAINKVVILDSCHSGVTGSRASQGYISEIREGVTILTASTEKQYAMEKDGSGLFTGLLVDALEGGAANVVGDITPGSVYAHIDQSLGPWEQRPVFKTNVKKFVSLRKVDPAVSVDRLRELIKYFSAPEHQFQLDPTYEPLRPTVRPEDASIPPPDPDHTAVFSVLQECVKANLVRPVGAPHMWHAAMERKSCELTPLGRHYWKLVTEELI
jgi:uncharacterized caspase-like protein